jgi:hypothetical protein
VYPTQRKRAPAGAVSSRKRLLLLRCLVGFAAILSAFATNVAVSAGQTSSTVPFQGAYRGYNAWWDWKGPQADKCVQNQPIYGSEPASEGQYPVVVYLHSILADWVGNLEGRGFVELAAGQGFVAAAVTYDSWLALKPGRVDEHAKCMFAPGSSGNALAQVCARPKADCSKGVLLAGFSVGGAIAGRANNFSPQVRAAWLIGVIGPATAEALAPPAGTRALPNDRLRITTGRTDVEVRDPSTGQVTVDLTALNRLTGQDCAASPCLRSDGSGYYVVQHSEVADGIADHCYWLGVAPRQSCPRGAPTFDPGFRPPSTTPWSLITGLDWLRTRLD